MLWSSCFCFDLLYQFRLSFCWQSHFIFGSRIHTSFVAKLLSFLVRQAGSFYVQVSIKFSIGVHVWFGQRILQDMSWPDIGVLSLGFITGTQIWGVKKSVLFVARSGLVHVALPLARRWGATFIVLSRHEMHRRGAGRYINSEPLLRTYVAS